MTDKEKISLLVKIIEDSFDWNNDSLGFYMGLMCAINAIAVFREEDEG